MAFQVQNKSAQTNATIDAITYIKGTQCDSIQFYFLTKPPIILNWSDDYQTTPILLLSSSIFNKIKINGSHLTLPQFILSTEHSLRSAR